MAKGNTIYCKRFVKNNSNYSVFLKWDAASGGNGTPTFRSKILSSFLNVEKSKNRKNIQSCVAIHYGLIFKMIHMSVLLWYLIAILELDYQNNFMSPLIIMHLKYTVSTGLDIGHGALCTILSKNMHICNNSWYARGGQLAELRETQFGK
jgi:hypothetical protein